MTLTGTLKYSEKNLSQSNFFVTDPTWIGLESNWGLRDERPEADCLSCGMTTILYRIDANQIKSFRGILMSIPGRN